MYSLHANSLNATQELVLPYSVSSEIVTKYGLAHGYKPNLKDGALITEKCVHTHRLCSGLEAHAVRDRRGAEAAARTTSCDYRDGAR